MQCQNILRMLCQRNWKKNNMRLDKYLKLSLIYKTRSSAEKDIENGNVLLNNKKAKPASSVTIGDKLKVTLPLKETEYEIICIYEKNVSRKMAREMYKVIGEKSFEL